MTTATASRFDGLGYDERVSANDHMWASGPEWYFRVGLRALETIDEIVRACEVEPSSILDLPCGHGRICRMLRAAYPEAHLSACDIDRDGVDFCAETFAAEPVYSREDIREVEIERRFDLIWCGSLLTHMPRKRWPQLFAFFAEHLTPGGVAIVTTHGRIPIKWMLDGSQTYGLDDAERRQLLADYLRDGFAYMANERQQEGFSVASMAFACSQVQRLPAVRLVRYEEAGWAGHQDVLAFQRLRQPLRGRAELEAFVASG